VYNANFDDLPISPIIPGASVPAHSCLSSHDGNHTNVTLAMLDGDKAARERRAVGVAAGHAGQRSATQ
jgi:hypothetical protein